MKHVVCVKWGPKYIAQYANVLYKMCDRHITGDWDFHCITDNNKDLDPHIKTIALPVLTINHPCHKLKNSRIREIEVKDSPGVKLSCPSLLLFTTFEKSKTAVTTTPKMD